MEYSINNRLKSDLAWLADMGAFLKQSRLERNRSQGEVAEAAGINRTTLSALENGQGGSLGTFIQVLRALDLMDTLTVFQKKPTFSPIQMSKLQGKMPKRASKRTALNPKNESTW